MNPNSQQGGRDTRPPAFLHDLAELAIVAGLGLLAIFVVIPSQTSSAGEIGLSPGLLPTACAAAIVLLALLQFILKLIRRLVEPEAPRTAPGTALMLIAATVAGAAVVRLFGWELGGAAIVLLVSLVLGERRPARLTASAAGAAAVLFAVGWLGV